MKRRFRNGVELSDSQFHAQPWERGLLTFQGKTLYLCESTPDSNPGPYGGFTGPR